MHRDLRPVPDLYPALVPNPVEIPLSHPNPGFLSISVPAHVSAAPTSELPPPVKHNDHGLNPFAPPPGHDNGVVEVLSQTLRQLTVKEEASERADLDVTNREFRFSP